jgi:hypothetical protein
MNSQYRQFLSQAIQNAESGNWDEALQYAKKVPSNWNVYEQLPSIGIPPEHLDKVLSQIPKSVMPSFLFELSSNLHSNTKKETLERIAKMSLEDHYVQENVKNHPNWSPSDKTQNLQAVSDFWRSYERKVHPFHFAAIKSMFTGQPESITDHRGNEGSSHGHYLGDGFVYDLKDAPTVQSWQEPIKKYGGMTIYKPEAFLGHFKDHAVVMERAAKYIRAHHDTQT